VRLGEFCECDFEGNPTKDETFSLLTSPTSLVDSKFRIARCMADPHAVPLPPSRGSLDSNREFDQQRSNTSITHLPPLTESEPPSLQDQEGERDTEQQSYQEEENERIRILEEELDRTREDRDAWENQYQGLLAKLTTMRNTVGDKLKQDAVSR